MDRRNRGRRPRLIRTISPAVQDKPVSARRDPKAEEMIRFVRECQMEKEPALLKQAAHLRLQKRAPLPSIGQRPRPPAGDCSFIIQNEVERFSDSDSLDDEVAAIENISTSPSPYELKVRYALNRIHRNPRKHSKPIQSLKTNNAVVYTYDTLLNSFGRFNPRIRDRSSVNQLPPIHRDRLPERPSAPSPRLTSHHSVDLDSTGEPIDFIDP